MVKTSNLLVLKRTKKGGGEKKTTTENGGKNAKPQGSSEWTGLTGFQITKTQTLAPINGLHKLQLKPWALI